MKNQLRLNTSTVQQFRRRPATAAASGGIDSFAKLMLHLNEANGATAFADSSLSPKAVTNVGGVVVGSNGSAKFGTTSVLWAGGSTSYLSLPDSADWVIGAGAMTCDFWAQSLIFGGNPDLSPIAWGQFTDANNYMLFYGDTANFGFRLKIAGVFELSSLPANSRPNGTWFHYAIVKGWGGDNTSVAYCVNGVAIATFTSLSAWPDFTGAFKIGYEDQNQTPFNGYMQEFRWSKGIARWTANFTPPSAPYTV